MYFYNFYTGVDLSTKFLVLDSVSCSASYFLILTFHLCFGFEAVVGLDQYTGLVPYVPALCLHVCIILRFLTVVLSVQPICPVCIYIAFLILTQLLYFHLFVLVLYKFNH